MDASLAHEVVGARMLGAAPVDGVGHEATAPVAVPSGPVGDHEHVRVYEPVEL